MSEDESMESSSAKGDSTRIAPLKSKNSYRVEWENDASLSKFWTEHDTTSVFCPSCDSWIKFESGGKSKLVKHSSSAAHIKKLKNPTRMDSATNAALVESAIVYAVVKHAGAYAMIDDICSGLKFCLQDQLKDLHLGQSKAKAIVKNVLSPYSVTDYFDEIRTNKIPYCVILDASNIFGNRKIYPVVLVSYFPNLGLKYLLIDVLETSKEDSIALVDLILTSIAEKDLPSDLINGFCGDNAFVNFGSFKSIFVGLNREVIPESDVSIG